MPISNLPHAGIGDFNVRFPVWSFSDIFIVRCLTLFSMFEIMKSLCACVSVSK